jgi:hypothetical protein
MVVRQLLVKDMRAELGVNQITTLVAAVAVLARLVQTHLPRQLVEMAV